MGEILYLDICCLKRPFDDATQERVRREAEANCYAVQLVYYMSRVLKLTPGNALRMERLAVRTTRASAPRGYWDSQRCRDGGAWDLDDEDRNLDY